MRRLAVLSLAIAAAACGTDDGGDPADTGTSDSASDATSDSSVPFDCDSSAEPTFELFTSVEQTSAAGGLEFVLLPIDEDTTLPIFAGPQGGYHVWGAFTASGLAPKDASIHFELTVDGAEVAGVEFRDDIDYVIAEGSAEGAPAVYEYFPVTVIFRVEHDIIESYFDQPATLSVTVVDACGTTVSDSAEVTISCCEF